MISTRSYVRRREEHSRSLSRRRLRRASRSRSRIRRQREASIERERERKEIREREKRGRERTQRHPSDTLLVHGIPESDREITEDRLEKVCRELALKAGCSMPEVVRFAYDRSTHHFRGFAIVQFPHEEASKTFFEYALGGLDVHGLKLRLEYHQSNVASERSLSRGEQGQRRERERAQREEQRQKRERERALRHPSETVLAHGIPESGMEITEDKLESVCWEVAVKAGCSMPESVRFAYDRSTQEFRGFAIVQFPHKEASKLFVEHTSSVLEVDSVKLRLEYHHAHGLPARSRSRSQGGDRPRGFEGEPSSTLIVKGMASSVTEASVVDTFQAFATVKDIRHFPPRGFAFVQFHSIEDATVALNGFECECRGKLEGRRVFAHFAKERENGNYPGFAAKQAIASAEAEAEVAKVAYQQVAEENTAKALSGVNAEMWAGYMRSVAQTETVQSANTFEFDKESGYYLDSKAGLYYDPNTTYFFTTDFKTYFIYDHEEKMLCRVGSDGTKVAGGERRELPSLATQAGKTRSSSSNASRQDRDRLCDRERDRERCRERVHERDRDRERDHDRHARDRDREDRRAGDTQRGRDHGQQKSESIRDARNHHQDVRDVSGGGRDPPREVHKAHRNGDYRDNNRNLDQELKQPIYYPGGDPLARLAPAPSAEPAHATPPKKKKPKPSEQGVLGLAEGPAPPIPTVAARPGPVTLLTSLWQPSADSGQSRGTSGDWSGDWICEVCMRKFNSEEQLRRHEELSELHQENLAKLNAAL